MFERSLFGFGNWVTTIGGLIMFMWDTQGISPQVIVSWRSSLHMRHDMESCDQGWEDRDQAWLDRPVASVKGKLGDDLVLMDRGNGEEQVRSRSIDQQGHMMI
jgi:hypothetical protein